MTPGRLGEVSYPSGVRTYHGGGQTYYGRGETLHSGGVSIPNHYKNKRFESGVQLSRQGDFPYGILTEHL